MNYQESVFHCQQHPVRYKYHNPDMELPTTAGDRIRNERKALGWTQGRLAKEAKIPNARQSFVSAIENGSQSHSKYFSAIVRALGLNEEWVNTGRGLKHLRHSAPSSIVSEPERPAYDAADPLIREAVELLKRAGEEDRKRFLVVLRSFTNDPEDFKRRTGNE